MLIAFMVVALLAPGADASPVDARTSPEFQKIQAAAELRRRAVTSIQYSYTRDVRRPLVASRVEAEAIARSELVHSTGEYAAQGAKFFNSETRPDRTLPEVVAFDGQMYRRRPADPKALVSQGREESSFLPFAGDPWAAQEPVTSRLADPAFLTRIIAVERVDVDGRAALRIRAEKEVRWPVPEKPPVVGMSQDTLWYSVDSSLLLRETVVFQGERVLDYRLLEEATLDMNGTRIAVPLKSRSVQCEMDGCIRRIDEWRIQREAIHVNDPIAPERFQIPVTARDAVYDKDLDIYIQQPVRDVERRL